MSIELVEKANVMVANSSRSTLTPEEFAARIEFQRRRALEARAKAAEPRRPRNVARKYVLKPWLKFRPHRRLEAGQEVANG